MTVVYGIDGSRIGSLEDFWLVMGEAVNGPGAQQPYLLPQYSRQAIGKV